VTKQLKSQSLEKKTRHLSQRQETIDDENVQQIVNSMQETEEYL
jgi:hypothetical protein